MLYLRIAPVAPRHENKKGDCYGDSSAHQNTSVWITTVPFSSERPGRMRAYHGREEPPASARGVAARNRPSIGPV